MVSSTLANWPFLNRPLGRYFPFQPFNTFIFNPRFTGDVYIPDLCEHISFFLILLFDIQHYQAQPGKREGKNMLGGPLKETKFNIKGNAFCMSYGGDGVGLLLFFFSGWTLRLTKVGG